MAKDNQSTLSLPPGVIGALLIFWGASGENLGLGITLAALIEGVKLSRVRWAFTAKHFQNIADLTTVIFAVVIIYQFVQHAFHGIYGILDLLPLCIFPLLVAQRFSVEALFPMSALFLSLRRKIAKGEASEQWVSTEFLYAMCCILATSTHEFSNNAYMYGALLATLATLFFYRASGTNLLSWLAATGLVVVLAFGVQFSVESAYRSAESSLNYWFSQIRWPSTNPNFTRTSIGQLGRLKLSDKIVLRLKAPLSVPLPIYLHQASYTQFKLGSWHAKDFASTALDPLPSADAWQFSPYVEEDTYQVEITAQQPREVSVQAIPLGSVAIDSKEIIEVRRNPLGTTSLEAIPGQLRYNVKYLRSHQAARSSNIAVATEQDLEIPAEYLAAFQEIHEQLALATLAQKDALTSIIAYFQNNFSYSLVGKNDFPGRKPLISFLTTDRSGHCEYFASATVLLLRAAGIPARYAVGYTVDEYSALEQAFIARARHAHAWAEAYVDGQWRVIDTTPGQWLELEAARVSNWQTIQDYLAWIKLHLSRLQRVDRSAFNSQIIWAIPILSLVLMYRLRKRIRNVTNDKTYSGEQAAQIDADLKILFNVLESLGVRPAPGQTVRSFLQQHLHAVHGLPPVRKLIGLYYRKRFSEQRLSSDEYSELRNGLAGYAAHLNELNS